MGRPLDNCKFHRKYPEEKEIHAADHPHGAGKRRHSPIVQHQPRGHDQHVMFHYTEHGLSVPDKAGDATGRKKEAVRLIELGGQRA